MTLNLDVSLKLVDGLTRPVADATKSLDRFGATATRLASRTNGLATSLRGLAGALREVRAGGAAANTAGASTGRLRGTLSSVALAARKSAAGLGAFTREANRLAAASNKAAAGARTLKGALSGTLAGGGFVSAANTQMRDMIAMQRTALGNMRQLNAGSGGRRGMTGGNHGSGATPGVMLALQPHVGTESIHSVYEQATSLQDAIVKMHLNGLSDADIDAVRAKADEVARLNKSTTPLSNLNAIMEARLALGGDLSEALATAGEMSKLRTIAGYALGKDRAKSAEDGVYDMLRTAEVRGLVNDPARRAALFKGMTAAMIASNGRITPKMWHSTAIYGRSATQGFSDEFQNGRLPFLMQELQNGGKGGPAGTALQALFRAIPLAITKASNIAEWRKLGFIDESKVVKDDKGRDEHALPGAITLGKLAISDPDQAVYRLMDAMKANGIVERSAMIQEFAQLIGTGTGQTAVDILGLQRGRMDNFERTLKMVEDNSTLLDQINMTASQNVENLNVSMQTLSGNIGSMVIPAFTSLVDGANRFVGVVNRAATIGGGNGNDPVNGKGGLDLAQVGMLGAGAAYGIGALAARFPFLGKLMASAAGTAATGSPAGALLGPAVSGGLARLTAMLPGAVRTGLTAGLRGGIITGLAYEGGKALISGALSLLPKPNLTPDKQAAFDAHMKRWDDAYIWQKPGLIWQDAFGKHETTAPTANAAGARAAGGPVTRGLSYLVGERGPELFTPGLSGGISNHAVLGMMASGGGGAGSGELVARALRYMSFDLVSVLTMLASRLGSGRAGDSGDGSGVGGADGGGGNHGRRGFMGHNEQDAGAPEPVLARAGISDASVGSGLNNFNIHGVKLRGQGITPINPDAFLANSVPGATNGRLAESRASFFDELDRNPSLRRDVMKTVSMENGRSGASTTSVLESMVNRAQMRGYTSLNQSIHDGFYGPVNRGGLRGALSEQARIYGEQAIRNVRRGSNQIGYRTDQGMLTDPGARKYMRQADKSGWQVHQGENFFWMGDKGRAWAKRQEELDRSQPASQGSVGAFGLGGFNAPGGFAGNSEERMPSVLRERARRMHERHERERAAAKASAGGVTNVHVTNHIHPGPGHDEKHIAEAVHRKFNDAVRSQLNDGAFT